MNKLRKITQFISYYLLPFILAISSYLLYNKQTFSNLGNIAFILLAVNLYLKPLSVIFKNKLLGYLSTYRRELGIASFWFYFFHSIGFFLLYNLSISRFFNTSSHSFWAMLGSICMWLLWITSNDKSIKLLKRNWKRLHRLAYPLFYFALIHSSLAEGEVEKIFILGIPFAILKIIEFKKIPFKW